MVFNKFSGDLRFTGFWGLGDLEKFCGRPVLGTILGETPADQTCLHAKCGPGEPCLGSHVYLGSKLRALWGGLGAISSVRDRFCLVGPNQKKTRFGRNSAPPGVFGKLDKFASYWFFGGLRDFRGPV